LIGGCMMDEWADRLIHAFGGTSCADVKMCKCANSGRDGMPGRWLHDGCMNGLIG
jgi:hypothetical protein